MHCDKTDASHAAFVDVARGPRLIKSIHAA
jgi:hypothetical protein